MNVKIGLAALAISFALTDVNAVSVGETCYVPKRGQALSTCVPEFDVSGNLINPCPETLGNFDVVLWRAPFVPWKTAFRAGKRRLKLGGPFRGLDNGDQTFDHVLGNEAGDGLLYTFNDSFETAIPEGKCLLRVKEVLNVTFGTGDYTGAYGTLVVKGTLNLCTGVNEFDVVPGEGELCFDAAANSFGDE